MFQIITILEALLIPFCSQKPGHLNSSENRKGNTGTPFLVVFLSSSAFNQIKSLSHTRMLCSEMLSQLFLQQQQQRPQTQIMSHRSFKLKLTGNFWNPWLSHTPRISDTLEKQSKSETMITKQIMTIETTGVFRCDRRHIVVNKSLLTRHS